MQLLLVVHSKQQQVQDRVELEGTNNTLTFYNSSNESVAQLGWWNIYGTTLRIDLDGTTTVGSDVRSRRDILGFNMFLLEIITSVGTNIQLTGATNTGIGWL